MKILAIDTSGDGCSVAVAEPESLICEINIKRNETHSKHLMGIIHSILELSGMHMDDIDGFAVSRGPGSFTGLRIGLSTIKGLSCATGKPVVTVSSLDALAWAVPFLEGRVCAMIDARKKEVYTASYSIEHGRVNKITDEDLVPCHDICRDLIEPTVFIGTGVRPYRDVIVDRMGSMAQFTSENFNHVSARIIADLSFERFAGNDFDDNSMIVPRYIRRSDAEINRSNHGGQSAMV